MIELGVGYLQLTPALFYEMTFEELRAMSDGKRNQDEAQAHMLWEIARWQNYYALAPHIKKGRRFTMRDVQVFPWEKKQIERELPTVEEVEKLRQYAWGMFGKSAPATKNIEQ